MEDERIRPRQQQLSHTLLFNMKLLRILFNVATLLTASISSFPIRSCQWDHELFCGHTLESISSPDDNLLIRRGHPIILSPNEISLRLIRLNARENTRSDTKGDQSLESHQRKLRKQRRSSIPPPDNESAEEKGVESANPTMKEMGQVLSPEEVESYINHWRAGKAYRMRKYEIKQGHDVLTEEDKKKFEADKLSFNEARRLELYVKRVLVESNRARPKLVESYEKYQKRLRSASVDAATMRKRCKDLKFLIDNEIATPDEVEEYKKLLAEVQHINKISSKSQAKRRISDKKRMQELESLIDDDVATDDERAEYKDLAAKLVRKHKINVLKNRKKELESRFKNEEATDDERAEYKDLLVGIKRENGLAAQRSKRFREKRKKARTGGTPSPEMESETADQTSAGQPLQLSSNPLLQKMTPLLNRLGKLWKAAPQARNSLWNVLPPVPGVTRPVPIPLGVTPLRGMVL